MTEHLSLHEFRSKRSNTPVPPELQGNVLALARELEVIRAVWARPLAIISGYRTEADNAAVGGAAQSQHLQAKAADIKVEGVSTTELYCAVLALIGPGDLRDGGLGWYGADYESIHYDIGTPRRWYTAASMPDCSRYHLPNRREDTIMAGTFRVGNGQAIYVHTGTDIRHVKSADAYERLRARGVIPDRPMREVPSITEAEHLLLLVDLDIIG